MGAYSFFDGSSDYSSDYAYLYGRVSGMMGKLLSERDVEAFTLAQSDVEVLASLKATGYEKYVRDLAREYTALDVDERLYGCLREVFDELMGLAPEKARASFKFFFSGLWEHANRKTLLRGIHHRMSWTEISGFINPLGETKKDELMRLALNMKEVLLSYEGAEKLYSEYESSGRLEVLESFLDSVFIRGFVGKLSQGVFEEYARTYSDLLNIKNVLLCARYGINAAPYLTDCGLHLLPELLRKAQASELSELPQLFSKTPYVLFVSTALERLRKEETLYFVDRMAHAHLTGYLKDKSRMNPLSIYPAAYFIELKVGEIKTLRGIILSKRGGLSPEEIRRIVSEA